MSVRHSALVCLAAFAIVMPARADVILGFRIGAPPSGNDQTNPIWIDNQLDPINDTNQPVALGAPIVSPLVFLFYPQTIYLQVTIATNANALSSPTPSFPQSAWTNTNSLKSFAFGLSYPQNVVNPFAPPIPPIDPDQNNHNARAIVPFATGNPSTFTGYNMGSTALTGSTTGVGVGAAAGQIAGNERVIAVFRLVLGSYGSGAISLFDLNTDPTAAGFSLQDGQNVDEYIFHPSHANSIQVIVTPFPLPEPSSMALAGVALAGIGWRKWRRRQTSAGQ